MVSWIDVTENRHVGRRSHLRPKDTLVLRQMTPRWLPVYYDPLSAIGEEALDPTQLWYFDVIMVQLVGNFVERIREIEQYGIDLGYNVYANHQVLDGVDYLGFTGYVVCNRSFTTLQCLLVLNVLLVSHTSQRARSAKFNARFWLTRRIFRASNLSI